MKQSLALCIVLGIAVGAQQAPPQQTVQDEYATYELLARRTFPKFRPSALWYEQPIYYFGNHLTFVASGTPIAAPAYADALDYELELGFVIDKPLLDASPEQAAAAISGYVVLNDCSARNVQVREMRSGFGPQKAKHFASSMSAVAVTHPVVTTHAVRRHPPRPSRRSSFRNRCPSPDVVRRSWRRWPSTRSSSSAVKPAPARPASCPRSPWPWAAAAAMAAD